jgi:hypothetical protein
LAWATDVLEVKGALDKLPERLLPMSRYLKKESISKYANCCTSLMSLSSSRRSA